MTPALIQKLAELPQRPGVYIYRDARGKVIYVGKAVNLRSRVRSYFQESKGHSAKTLALVGQIRDLETLVTPGEVDALILEGNLIKKHKPRYNILLKDDKSFPYLMLTDEPYPRLLVTRKPHEAPGRYFGPYVHAAAMRETQRLVQRHLGIRQCDIEIDRKRPRPCLYYDLHQCDAPCVSWGETQKQYAEHAHQARLLLEGREDSLLDEIKTKMHAAAQGEKFEDAARWRDSWRALETVRARQRVVLKEPKDVDLIALAQGEGGQVVVQVFYVRAGKLIDRRDCRLRNHDGASPGEVLSSFLPQFYAGGTYVPDEIVVSHEFEDWTTTRAWLAKRRGKSLDLSFPQKGEKKRWVEMVEENARLLLKSYQAREAAEQDLPQGAGSDGVGALAELAKIFGLAKPPRRIDGFDISHVQGSHTVASMVVMIQGRSTPSEYRHFKVKEVKGIDDFASMREVVGRRYRRMLDEKGPLPDLLLIDGGKGQLSAAMDALKKLGLEKLKVFGLAKRLEEIYLPGQEKPLRLDDRSPGRLMLQRLRDEAHRFAITYHRKLRAKAMTHSVLDDVKGLGPVLRKRLLTFFGSVDGLRRAKPGELEKIKGLSRAVRVRLQEALV